MHKLFTLCAVLLVGTTSLFAQNPSAFDPTGKFYVSVQAGPAVTIGENTFTYKDRGYTMELITPQASVSFGYDFNRAFGLRANVGYGKNMGACNSNETAAHGFYPYSYKSINYFVDAVLQLNHVNNTWSAFCPKLYFGLGGANSFGFSEVPFSKYQKTDIHHKRFHPWQDVNEQNSVAAFRLGFIAEYNFRCGLGIFADLAGEAYTDNFNGLMPQDGDFEAYQGYAGFPFDLRGLVSLGVAYHF